jgi:two-component system sensor histidine kinase KdpD
MSDGERPDPDDLLRRYGFALRREVHERGRLRVFLGAAPGVGKTYAMLNEGRRLKREGNDVVVGFVEAHGRTETEAQIGDLEVIPRLKVPYRGITVEEMDTDAILRRKPGIVLIDELAHTNAPGSPRQKRYEDVELLRDAGIDVITTVNIQHLESLNDIVAGITGVEVHETLPDRILDGAAEVQLVDLPVDALVERLLQGKVYPPERARKALEHFFREGNLTALRELALRRTAAGVDERLESYMHEHKIEEVWPAAERVIVLVDGRASAGTVIRSAWRLASALRGDLVAVAVVPPGGLATMADEDRVSLERQLHLAEDLGATVRVVAGEHVARTIAAAVREENAQLVVLGHCPDRGWRHFFGRSLVDQLLHLLDHVDIHVVELKGESG